MKWVRLSAIAEEQRQETSSPTWSRPVRLTLCARVLPDGKLQGTVGPAEASAVSFEGWLELLASLTDLLGFTQREPP